MTNNYCNYVDINGKNRRKKLYNIDGKLYVKIKKDKYILKTTFLRNIKKGGFPSRSSDKQENLTIDLKNTFIMRRLKDEGKQLLENITIDMLCRAIKDFNNIYLIFTEKGENYKNKIKQMLMKTYKPYGKINFSLEESDNPYNFNILYDKSKVKQSGLVERMSRLLSRTKTKKLPREQYYMDIYKTYLINEEQIAGINIYCLLINYILQFQDELELIIKTKLDVEIDILPIESISNISDTRVKFIKNVLKDIFIIIINNIYNIFYFIFIEDFNDIDDSELLKIIIYLYSNIICFNMIYKSKDYEYSPFFKYLVPIYYFDLYKYKMKTLDNIGSQR